MKIYHFSCGNSTHGAVGLCAGVMARSKEAAVLRLQRALAAAVGAWGEIPVCTEQPSVEYINVYVSPQNIRGAQIDQARALSE